MSTRRPDQSLRRIFTAPVAIAIFSAVGLVAALVGDGPFDVLSWIGLGAPVAAVIWALMSRRS